jgi:hypothetical protein
VVTGAIWTVPASGASAVRVGVLLAAFPVALLERTGPSAEPSTGPSTGRP